jgi:hypothetical protein
MSKAGVGKMNHGRFAIMRDLQDHLIAGKLNFFDLGIYTAIHWQADFKTGIWWGSAPKLHAIGPTGFSLRSVQRSIEKLTRIGFLKPFHKHGQRGNYPVLINKYLPLSGALRNFRLNAAASADWRSPKYEPCALRDTLHDTDGAPIQYSVSSNQESGGRQKPAAKPAPPADPRFQPFFAFAFESFAVKHSRKPLWQGKDRNVLKNLLKDQSAASLPLERLQTNWRNFLDSTEAFTVKQGDSLAYFCSNLDKFSDGPILQSKGKGNGKIDVNDAIATTMRGFAANSGITH